MVCKCHSQKLAYLSLASSPIKKKHKSAAAAGQVDIEDNMVITITWFEDILKTESVAIHTEFVSHVTTIQNMCYEIDFLTGEQKQQKKKWSTNTSSAWMPTSNK